MIHFSIYARKSTEDKSRQIRSIPDQLEEIKTFAEKEKLFIDQTYTEEKSAKVPGRPEFNKMMRKVELSKQPRGIISWHADRLARNSLDGGRIVYLFANKKLVLKFPTMRVDADPNGIFMLNVIFAQSEHYSNHLSETMIRAYTSKAKRGEIVGKVPYGYEKIGRDIIINEEKKNIVLQIFKDFNAGYPIHEILRRAQKIGFPRSGHSTIQHILQNPIYAGKIRAGQELYDGIHLPIIDFDTYYATMYRLKEVHRPVIKAPEPLLPLRGIILCQQCEQPLTGARSTGHGGFYWYYKCNRCPENHSAPKAHEQLLKILSAMSAGEEMINDFIKGSERELKELVAARELNTDKLKKEIAALQEKMDSLDLKFLANQVDNETYDKWDKRFKSEIAFKKEELSEASTDKDEFMQQIRVALPQMRDLGLFYTDCNFSDKQEFLRLLFPKGLFKSKIGYRTFFVNDIFDLKAAIQAGLQVITEGENVVKSGENVKIALAGGKSNLFDHNFHDLIAFMAKGRAAA